MGGRAVVADRIWLHRLLVAISMHHANTNKVMIHFPGLINWPVGKNKKATFYLCRHFLGESKLIFPSFFPAWERQCEKQCSEKKRKAGKQQTNPIHGMTSDSVAQSRPSVALALGLSVVFVVAAVAVAVAVAAEFYLGVIGK